MQQNIIHDIKYKWLYVDIQYILFLYLDMETVDNFIKYTQIKYESFNFYEKNMLEKYGDLFKQHSFTIYSNKFWFKQLIIIDKYLTLKYLIDEGLTSLDIIYELLLDYYNINNDVEYIISIYYLIQHNNNNKFVDFSLSNYGLDRLNMINLLLKALHDNSIDNVYVDCIINNISSLHLNGRLDHKYIWLTYILISMKIDQYYCYKNILLFVKMNNIYLHAFINEFSNDYEEYYKYKHKYFIYLHHLIKHIVEQNNMQNNLECITLIVDIMLYNTKYLHYKDNINIQLTLIHLTILFILVSNINLKDELTNMCLNNCLSKFKDESLLLNDNIELYEKILTILDKSFSLE